MLDGKIVAKIPCYAGEPVAVSIAKYWARISRGEIPLPDYVTEDSTAPVALVPTA